MNALAAAYVAAMTPQQPQQQSYAPVTDRRKRRAVKASAPTVHKPVIPHLCRRDRDYDFTCDHNVYPFDTQVQPPLTWKEKFESQTYVDSPLGSKSGYEARALAAEVLGMAARQARKAEIRQTAGKVLGVAARKQEELRQATAQGI